MFMTKRLLMLLSMLIIALFVVVACGPGAAADVEEPVDAGQQQEQQATPTPEPVAPPDAPVGRTHLNVVTSNLAISMDPVRSNDSASAQVNVQIYDRLFGMDYDTFEILPQLAIDWSMPDAQTVAVELRRGVVFHNGQPMNAYDVQWSLERAGASPHMAAVTSPIDTVTVVDDYNVIIHLEVPFAPILRHLAHSGTAIVPYGMEEEELAEHPIGTGPWMFDSLVIGDRLELVRNPNFWGEAPLLDTMTIRLISDSPGRLLAVETGEADLALGLLPTEAAPAEAFDNVVLNRRPNLSTTYVGFNTIRPPFDNPLIRRAVNHAIDTQTIVDVVLHGVGAPAEGPIADIVWGFYPVGGLDFDIERARELMAEAGYPDGLPDPVEIWWNVPNMVRSDISDIIQHSLREIGIEVTVAGLEWATYLEDLEDPDSGWNMFVLGWVSLTGDADYGLFPLFHSSMFGGAGNRTFFATDELDDLLERGRSELDENARLEIYRQALEVIRDESPWVFINQGEELHAASLDLRGFIVNPGGHQNFSRIWFDE
jgi:peptide/nickel transport system substrate-binding protein